MSQTLCLACCDSLRDECGRCANCGHVWTAHEATVEDLVLGGQGRDAPELIPAAYAFGIAGAALVMLTLLVVTIVLVSR